MSQMSTPSSGLARPSGENDVYTALILAALILVLIATIYVGYRTQTLFGTLLPPGGS